MASQAADGDLQARLYDHSNQLAQLAVADRGPDHGRLARHLNALNEMESEGDEEVAAHVRNAREEITAYRETVDGV